MLVSVREDLTILCLEIFWRMAPPPPRGKTAKKKHTFNKQENDGTWEIKVRSEQLAQVLAGLGLPEVAASGTGKFNVKPDTTAVAASGDFQAQIAKLEVNAPMDGVILTRNVEPGEFVQPGAAALTIGNLSDLTITVYVPENRYGEVALGQTVEVVVDSFPGVTFTATVIQIANKAEFTPRNVQTVEGRSATMFAIKLSVQDSEGRLKPGMPADVVFQ